MDTTTTKVIVPDPVPVVCLYCGSSDDIYEVLNTVDERTSEYALQCGLCGGVWTQ
jgi:uncharacterized Zn finger protein